MRTGDAAAIDWYHEHDRMRSGSREQMAQAAYTGWKNDMLAGKTTLLAAQARAERVAAG